MTIAPVAALAVDRVLGKPPARLHPVVWMGGYCAWAGTRMVASRAGRRHHHT